MSIKLELPRDSTSHILADWLEINALLDADGNASIQELIGLLSNGAENVMGEDQIGDSASEIAAQETMNEILRRSIACGDSYPYEVTGSIIQLKADWVNYLSYVFPLLISYFGVDSAHFTETYHVFGKYFEELNADALKNYISSDDYPASTKVFGFPRSDNTRFSKAVEELCKTIPGFTAINTELAKVQQDGGLDIIAWKKFPDELSGAMVFLCQSAMGKNWQEKLFEASSIRGFINMPSDALTGVFIPHTVDTSSRVDEERWSVYTNRAGRIFERCRIAHLSPHWDHERAKTLCSTTIANLSAITV